MAYLRTLGPLVVASLVGLLGAPDAVAQNLASLWAFEGDFNDSSPNNNDASEITGSPTFVTGKFGQGASFVGATGDGAHLHFGAAGLPLVETSPWSMNLWAKFDAPPGSLEHLAGFGIDDGFSINGEARTFLAFGGPNANNFYFWGGGVDRNSGVSYEADGAWHMYTITYDGTDLRMYKDASLVSQGPLTGLTFALDEIHVGNPSNWSAGTPDALFDGALDEFSIFSGSLSTGQIGGLFVNNNINQPAILDPTLTVNRATGEIVLNNNSSFPISVLGYSIRSEAGALKPPSWSTVRDRFDAPPPGDGSIDANEHWTLLTDTDSPFSVELSEGAAGGDGGTIAVGKVINFGPAWAKNPIEDVVIDLLLNDGAGTIKTVQAAFTGNGDAQFVLADYDGNNVVNAADWNVFRTAPTADLAGATQTQAYFGGDLDGDFDKDIYDFDAFVDQYEQFNGLGSFATVGVPEPASLAVLLMAIPAAVMARRRRPQWVVAVAACMLVLAFGRPAAAAPWGYYPLNGNADDESNTNIDLMLIGNSTFGGSVHPGLGYALQTDGVDGGAIGQNFNKFVSNNITVMAWANADDLSNDWDTIIKNWGQTIGGQFHLGLGNALANTLQMHFAGGGPTTAPGDFPTGEWVHVAFVMDATVPETRLYMNGEVVQTGTYSGTLPLGGATTALGIAVKPNDDGTAAAANAAGVWDGRIDEVGLFDVAMSTAEVLQAYNNGLNGIQLDGTTKPYLDLVVDRGTGQVNLRNNTSGALSINAYQIASESGSLNAATWQDLAGNAGFPTGNGSGNGWETDAASGNNLLMETYLTNDSSVNAGANISLGNVFRTGQTEDLKFAYRDSNGVVIESLVTYTGTGPSLDADFDNNGIVDGKDFLIWQRNFGTGTTPDQGDADANGQVNAADLAIWKTRYGQASSVGATTATPEPASGGLMLVGLIAAFAACQRGRN